MALNKDGRLYRAAQACKWRLARAMLGGMGTYGAQMVIPWGERTWEYPWVLRRLPPTARTVLDFGPGPDSPLPLWLSCQGFAVTTVDFREPAVRIPGVEARTGDLATLDLPSGTFDVVTCVSVFEHVAVASYGQHEDPDRPLRLLRRMGTLLAPGGRVLLTLPAGRSAASRVREDGYRVYSPLELQRLAADASLTVHCEDYVKVGTSGFWEPATAAQVAAQDSASQITALAGLVLGR